MYNTPINTTNERGDALMNTSLLDIMSNVSGASFIGLDTVTTVKLRGGQKNPMQGRVHKHMVGASVMVFSNTNSNAYDNAVKRRLEKEGKNPEDFKISPRQWGERVHGAPIVLHKGAEYLEVIFLKGGQVSYTLDGQPIDKAEIQGLDSKPEGDQGGLDDKVIIRTFKADSIKAIRIDGQSLQF